MDVGNPRRSDEAADGVMAAIYQQLDDHVSESDRPYDVEAGLGQLMESMRADREHAHVQVTTAHSRSPVRIAAGDAGSATEYLDVRSAEMAMSMAERATRDSDRKSYFAFGSILAFAVATVGLLAFVHLPTTVIAAAVTMNGVVAAAGTLIQHGSLAVHRSNLAFIRRLAGHSPEPAERPEYTRARQHHGELQAHSGEDRQIVIHGNVGTLQVTQSRAHSHRPVGLRDRTGTMILVGLTIAVATAIAASVIGLMMHGASFPFAVEVFVPSGTSILLLITTWWWRVMDRRGPGNEAVPPAKADVDRDS